ncbi:unnamed protein product [Kuraishia capsulata CBS 1993]|uniref:Uncharacterized protein n=1 Tax=Kuraishia capsulata CBS 1993 TaxID=1382522 RepID=W6MRX3_9ASCO|nr:uncharacterized protein KUCA_T00005120001 [Kuraishia capsulata CBS 1993]CDK29133.1 unnamed protein product [Kuraishia capsulata CBS 1993]
MIPPAKPTGLQRIIVITIGLVVGSAIGVYQLRDYELVKYEPPAKVEYNEDGTPKPRPLKLSFQTTSPLQLKPEIKERNDRLLREKQAEKQVEKQADKQD